MQSISRRGFVISAAAAGAAFGLDGPLEFFTPAFAQKAPQDVFKFKQTGVGPGGKTLGHYEATGTVPEFVHDLRKRGVDTDLAMFRA